MEIMPMNPSHVAQVAALEKLCFSLPWSEHSIASELDNPLSYWLVAVDGERLLGYVGSQIVGDEADMMNLAVSPESRRTGTGRLLCQRLIHDLTEKGVGSLTLEVRPSNSGAVALYEKLGFLRVGRRPRYYQNPREDALILKKEWKL